MKLISLIEEGFKWNQFEKLLPLFCPCKASYDKKHSCNCFLKKLNSFQNVNYLLYSPYETNLTWTTLLCTSNEGGKISGKFNF